ncbi:hypothetical protein MMC25_006125 [Agyrium rufum]|nr:hypothetical protein [Agyrium rufum]
MMRITPIPIIRFHAPDNFFQAQEWMRNIIDDEHFTVIHELTCKKFDGPTGLDSIESIGPGELRKSRQSATSESPGPGAHWGTGNADVGKVGDDPFAYVASLDPFHGTTVCVYTKADRGFESQGWQRHVLDVYGTPTQQLKNGDGPGHFLVCADFDGDGDDEFLVSLFGPVHRDEHGNTLGTVPGPDLNKGIVYYKAVDLVKGIFAKWKVGQESSARIALGDFSGRGNVDFVSMNNNVERNYEEPHPKVTLHQNDFSHVKSIPHSSAIFPTIWDAERMIYLLDPSDSSKVTTPSKAHLIEVADYAVTVEVYPKKHKITIAQDEGIKVLFGSIDLLQEERVSEVRDAFEVPPFTASKITTSTTSAVASESQGAILLRMRTAAEVPVATSLELTRSGLALPPLQFIKAENLSWGEPFKELDFYNLSGFHFRFLESKLPIAHMQFWTAGKDVNRGVHNHSSDIFCEVHVGLSAGTQTGGMSRLKESYRETPPEKLNELGKEAFDHLVLPPLYEHGGIWKRDVYDLPLENAENVVQYPYHKWQAGEGEYVDVWMALELNPKLARGN